MRIAAFILRATVAVALIVLLGYLCSLCGLFDRWDWLILLVPTAPETLLYVGIWLVAGILALIAAGAHRIRRRVPKR